MVNTLRQAAVREKKYPQKRGNERMVGTEERESSFAKEKKEGPTGSVGVRKGNGSSRQYSKDLLKKKGKANCAGGRCWHKKSRKLVGRTPGRRTPQPKRGTTSEGSDKGYIGGGPVPEANADKSAPLAVQGVRRRAHKTREARIA